MGELYKTLPIVNCGDEKDVRAEVLKGQIVDSPTCPLLCQTDHRSSFPDLVIRKINGKLFVVCEEHENCPLSQPVG